MSKPQRPLLQKFLGDRKRNFEKTLRHKAAALLERAREAGSQDNRQADRRELSVGHKMSDGTVYAGISPDTGKPMYAMPADAPLTYTFNEAHNRARTANASKEFGHEDWRVPSKTELNVLFNNRAEIGDFDLSGSHPAGWYWSATPSIGWSAWSQRFSDGGQGGNGKSDRSSLRLVRSDAPKIS